jgi:hypothetical protein
MFQRIWNSNLNPFNRAETIEMYERKSWLQAGFDRGYNEAQIERIQNQWRLQFPPDLIEAYRQRRYLSDYDFDWLKTDPEEVQAMLNWPRVGLWCDVEEAGYWWPEWGERPQNGADLKARFADVTAGAPTLIPIGGHRYLPSEPCQSGNPVFSVWQSDIICYGSDLADWQMREEKDLESFSGRAREIRFWSEAARRG